MNIALLYEHPTWSDTLIETFQSNGQTLLGFSPEQRFVDYIKDTYSRQSAN